MDQPKQERTLTLLYLLSGNRRLTFKDLMDGLGLSRRSLHRYLATLKEHGYKIKREAGGVYRLQSYVPEQAAEDENIVFTREEAALLSHLIEGLDNTHVLKPTLQCKLSSVFHDQTVAPFIDHPWNAKNVGVLTAAIRHHRQVYLQNYKCSWKGKASDYVLEPYQLNLNCIDLWAYDVAQGRCKVFKLSRIGIVEMLPQGWKYEKQHRQKTYDVFHIAGDAPLEHVKLRMSLKGRNLLVEEYPMAAARVWADGDFWFWEGDVYGFCGVGRFVLGLSDVVDVVEGDKLRAWLAARVEQMRVKFMPLPPSPVQV